MTGRFSWTDGNVRSALGLSQVDSVPENLTSNADGIFHFDRVSTDSRTASDGDLFVALKGENFDGHDYVNAAFENGARGAIVSQKVKVVDHSRIYSVNDTLYALGQLAAYRRTHLRATVVGITGSSGKTGTKDLMRAALSGFCRPHATTGNFNNRIGLPLTLLDVPEDTEVVIVEMGTNQPGEIGILADIAVPEIGVVTTVSETHIEKLDSLEGVLREKLDLLRGLTEDGRAVVGDDPLILSKEARKINPQTKVVGWSKQADSAFQPNEATMDKHGNWSFLWHGEPVHLRIPGRHSVVNALLALAVADMLDVPAATAASGVSSLETSPMRCEIRNIGELTLLLDCYNANPQSTRAALKLLADIEPERPKIAFLGDMLELGVRSEELHTTILIDAANMGFDIIVGTGYFTVAIDQVEYPSTGTEIISIADPIEAYNVLRDHLNGDEVILFKASRGFALERVIPEFERDFGNTMTAPEEVGY
tara:strand:- start:2572 stop:4011 length:1440 start_codon:yes stop_codon:yes gene_type:complete